jgi:hypothetical protein
MPGDCRGCLGLPKRNRIEKLRRQRNSFARTRLLSSPELSQMNQGRRIRAGESGQANLTIGNSFAPIRLLSSRELSQANQGRRIATKSCGFTGQQTRSSLRPRFSTPDTARPARKPNDAWRSSAKDRASWQLPESSARQKISISPTPLWLDRAWLTDQARR